MWKKINNFCKMFYPSYKDGVLSAAPMVRLKLGDVISDGEGNGLPGFILSPEFNYSESIWEIIDYKNEGDSETGKVPMMAKISFTYQVIHEQPPHNDEDYNFNFSTFRRMGVSQSEIPSEAPDELATSVLDGVLARGI
jgi:hypothetical protein